MSVLVLAVAWQEQVTWSLIHLIMLVCLLFYIRSDMRENAMTQVTVRLIIFEDNGVCMAIFGSAFIIFC